MAAIRAILVEVDRNKLKNEKFVRKNSLPVTN
jgi:hypothetical protein